MSKITVNSVTPPERKLVAVVGVGQRGIFFRDSARPEDFSSYLHLDANTIVPSPSRLEDHFEEGGSRTPVYEGDSITISITIQL